MFSRVFIFSAVCFLGFFAVQCSAKFLLETIPTFPELTRLQSYVEQLPQLSAELSKVDNYTLLAPTNEAFDSWLGEANPQPTLDDIEATLYYHLLHGIYPVASFTSLPKFTASFLTNSSYTNVTAGQTAQLSQDSRNFPLIRSGNGTNTSITTSDVVATGGLIQIVSSILQIPKREPIVVRDAKLSFFVGLLTKGGFLSTERDEFTTQLTNIPDTVYFAPNTEQALSQFSNITVASTDQLSDLLKYHVVSGRLLYSTDLKHGMNLTSLQGTNLTIRVGDDGSKFVNGAKILETDFLVANGVLHTIDSLLDPANTTSPFQPASSPGLSNPAIAAIIISVLATLCTAGGIVFFILRRRGFILPCMKRKLKISYPIYSSSRHELGSRETTKLGSWVDPGSHLAHKNEGFHVQAVELEAGKSGGQVWELHGSEKVGAHGSREIDVKRSSQTWYQSDFIRATRGGYGIGKRQCAGRIRGHSFFSESMSLM